MILGVTAYQALPIAVVIFLTVDQQCIAESATGSPRRYV